MAQIPGEIAFISKQCEREVNVVYAFQSSIHKGNFSVFFACFLKVEFLVGDCAWDLQCTLILINCFDATIEIWTMKFDAIKAYHLIRNGIMHNNTFTSNWFVSGLVIVYNTWHVFSPSLTGHANQDGFSTIRTQLFV